MLSDALMNKKLFLIVIIIGLFFLNFIYWNMGHSQNLIKVFEKYCFTFFLLFFIIQYLKAINKWLIIKENILNGFQKILRIRNLSDLIKKGKHLFVLIMLLLLLTYHVFWGFGIYNSNDNNYILCIISVLGVLPYFLQYYQEYWKDDDNSD